MLKTKHYLPLARHSSSRKKNRGVFQVAAFGGLALWQWFSVSVFTGGLLVGVGVAVNSTPKPFLPAFVGNPLPMLSEPITVTYKPTVNPAVTTTSDGFPLVPPKSFYSKPCVYPTPAKTTSRMGDVQLTQYKHLIKSLIIKENRSTFENPEPPNLAKWSKDAGFQFELLPGASMGAYLVKLPYAMPLFDVASVINRMLLADAKEPAETKLGCRYKYIEANLVFTKLKAETSDDTYFKDQWNIQSSTPGGAKFNSAWGALRDLTKSGYQLTPVTIAVIDDGIWRNENNSILNINIANNNNNESYLSDVPYLKGKSIFKGGYDDPYCSRELTSNTNCHGEEVASILGALSNNVGIVGALGIGKNYGEKFKILPIRVFEDNKESETTILVNGMLLAAGMENPSGQQRLATIANVINVSLGTLQRCDSYLQDTIEVIRQKRKNIVFVGAAGNSDDIKNWRMEDWTTSPANCDGFISVVAHNVDGYAVARAPFGAKDQTVSAPGVDISVMKTRADSYKISGSSYATPHVSALAAMLLAVNPNLAPQEIFDSIKESGTEPDSKKPENKNLIARRETAINALAAVEKVIKCIPVKCSNMKNNCCTIF